MRCEDTQTRGQNNHTYKERRGEKGALPGLLCRCYCSVLLCALLPCSVLLLGATARCYCVRCCPTYLCLLRLRGCDCACGCEPALAPVPAHLRLRVRSCACSCVCICVHVLSRRVRLRVCMCMYASACDAWARGRNTHAHIFLSRPAAPPLFPPSLTPSPARCTVPLCDRFRVGKDREQGRSRCCSVFAP